ncbi:MFS transporter [Bacillus inaquosorum]|uniref:MFS transporter n=1 Tax=Bacillus inaquosorum TaxID=483913 RepID=UPI00227DA8C2|nr:MFS transporter [Bacillus inaquosorum]MCY8055025.1 MFS transporter [Bacillus inaquosorum]MCY9409059.1 MFS transporter [Bacillus inaquosorum]MCY9415709.1 MFS transporter [Bacillus inaquosorum]
MAQMKSKAVLILYIVCFSAFFASLSQNIYSPIIPIIKESFHVSAAMVNVSVSVFMIVTAIMQIILGTIIDFKGARFVLIAGILATTAASIGCAVTTDFTLFLIFRMIQAAGSGALPLIAATTIGQLFTGSERGSAMGTYQMLLSAAPAVAPVLGGFIGGAAGYEGIFWMLTAISVVMLVANSMIFPKDSPAGSKQQTKGNVFTHYKSIFTNRTGNVILALSFVLFFIYFAVIVYLPILLTGHYHIDVSIAGLLYLPLALSTIAGTFLFKRIQAKISLNTLFIGSNAVAACSIMLFAVTHSVSLVLMALTLALFGISMGVIPPLYSTMITNEFEHNRGSAIGIFNFIRYTGMAAGPMISAYLLTMMPSAMSFGLLGLVFVALGFCLLPQMYPPQKRVKQKKHHM